MTFKNEIVSDADIDRYKLPFPKGEGRWWTRDAERDYYLWGGLVGNLAYEETQEGRFHLYIDGIDYRVYIQPGYQDEDLHNKCTIFNWTQIQEITPEPTRKGKKRLLEILKEALCCYGFDGRKNIYFPQFKVIFAF